MHDARGLHGALRVSLRNHYSLFIDSGRRVRLLYNCHGVLLGVSCRPLLQNKIRISEMEDPDTEAQLRNAPEHPPTSTTAYPQRAQPADIASTQHTATSANLLTNPTHPRLPNTAISQPQATGTNDHPHGNVSRSQITGNQGMLIFTCHKPCSH
jgi:hypothetical protein